MSDISVIELFQKSWNSYQKILDHNYMFHQEIYSAAKDFIQANARQPLTILDVGCGDASQSLRLFEGCDVVEYVGCDLSPFALVLAKQNLAPLHAQVTLIQEDMISCMQQLDRKFDVILSSYVLHHCSLAQKQAFFELAAGLLSDQGMLIHIDLVSSDTETRTQFIENYLDYACKHWSQLAPAELQAIAKHVNAYDFPEPTASLNALASRVDLAELKQIPRHTWHQATVFGKHPG